MKLPHLGDLTAKQFLHTYWQKKPLLIRGAFKGDFAPLTVKEIFTLAGYDDAETRLVTCRKGAWMLDLGPFRPADFRKLRNDDTAKWTFLIQDTQHFSHEAHALLSQFSFLPQSRIDDLMVSYAVKGGGVGPHVDSYDVFLLQGAGKRRWQISSQRDHTLNPNMPLKILQRFKAEKDWLLEEGDMLYLPPSYAHHGIAETDDCVTWSIGFRAPSNQELLETWLDTLRDTLHAEGRYADPNRKPAQETALIDRDFTQSLSTSLKRALGQAEDKAMLQKFIGCYLSQPKSHVEFLPPEISLSRSAFAKKATTLGIALDLRSRLLYDVEYFYLNGECLVLGSAERRQWQTLANTRHIAPTEMINHAGLVDSLYQQWQRGYLQLAMN